MNIRIITRTAILLALTILFQTLGRFIPLGQFNQFIVGPLVNACLLVAAVYTGLGGGAVVSVLSPFGAILTGATIPLPFAPFIAAGNFILVLAFFLLRSTGNITSDSFLGNGAPSVVPRKRLSEVIFSPVLKKKPLAGIAAGALLKFGFLTAAVHLFVRMMGIPANKAAVLVASFSWPQLITAAVGGVLAILVLKALEKAVKV